MNRPLPASDHSTESWDNVWYCIFISSNVINISEQTLKRSNQWKLQSFTPNKSKTLFPSNFDWFVGLLVSCVISWSDLLLWFTFSLKNRSVYHEDQDGTFSVQIILHCNRMSKGNCAVSGCTLNLIAPKTSLRYMNLLNRRWLLQNDDAKTAPYIQKQIRILENSDDLLIHV